MYYDLDFFFATTDIDLMVSRMAGQIKIFLSEKEY